MSNFSGFNRPILPLILMGVLEKCGTTTQATRKRFTRRISLHVLRLRSFTPVTYYCKLPGVHSLAAFLQLEIHRVNKHHLSVRYCSSLKE